MLVQKSGSRNVFSCIRPFTDFIPADFQDSIKLAVPALIPIIEMTMGNVDEEVHIAAVKALASLGEDGMLNRAIFRI